MTMQISLHPVRSLFKRFMVWCCLSVLLAFGTACADKAPGVSFQTIRGEVYGPTQYTGKVMLVNFWATSCTTCIKEMPGLISTFNKFKDRDFDTVAVAMSYDVPAFVVNFADTRQLPFKVALDLKGEAARAYGQVQITPTTFLIDKKGRIIKQFVGEPNFTDLHSDIEKALAEKV